MARSDLLIHLFRAGATGDQSTFRKAAEALIAEERAKKHDVLADRLKDQLKQNGHQNGTQSRLLDAGRDLLAEVRPRRLLSDLVLSSSASTVTRELIEEHHRVELLHSHNMQPRHRVLLAGPPGNGKTTLAEAIAGELAVPLLVVRYDTLIGSYLGETAQRLRRLFERAATMHCVLFFDEVETIAKERGDLHETGEIKRVVSSLLLQVDDLPSHTIVVVASNHPELLDRAVWRRFQIRLVLPAPTRREIQEMLAKVESRLGIHFEVSFERLAREMEGASFAEVEEFCLDVARRRILELPSENMADLTLGRLASWRERFTLGTKTTRKSR